MIAYGLLRTIHNRVEQTGHDHIDFATLAEASEMEPAAFEEALTELAHKECVKFDVFAPRKRGGILPTSWRNETHLTAIRHAAKQVTDHANAAQEITPNAALVAYLSNHVVGADLKGVILTERGTDFLNSRGDPHRLGTGQLRKFPSNVA